MRILFSSLGLVTLLSMAVACVDRPEDGDDDGMEEDVGAASSAQLDTGYRYLLKQDGVTVASVWVGTPSTGLPTEYWVFNPAYDEDDARTFEAASQSCGNWKRTMCSSGWSSATLYKAIYTQQTLNCALPPGPCTPPPNSRSFLGQGSWATADASGLPFAATYVNGACEYWAMSHTISAGTSTQVRLTPGFSSHGDFISQVCSQAPGLSTYFEATYVDLGSACSAIDC